MVEYIEENALVDTLFWACTGDLESVAINKLTISIQPYSGRKLRLNGVLPIGTDPVPFPPGTALRACAYYYGIHPLYAQIDEKISGGSFVFDSDYIIVHSYGFSLSWNSNPYIPDTRFWSGTSPDEIVYTNDCNYYLTQQKAMVDANNPVQWNPDQFIGVFTMAFTQISFPIHLKTCWHYNTFGIYEKVFIGSGNPD